MESPFLVGFLILGVVAAIGFGAERFRAWTMPAAVLATMALVVAAVMKMFR